MLKRSYYNSEIFKLEGIYYNSRKQILKKNLTEIRKKNRTKTGVGGIKPNSPRNVKFALQIISKYTDDLHKVFSVQND